MSYTITFLKDFFHFNVIYPYRGIDMGSLGIYYTSYKRQALGGAL